MLACNRLRLDSTDGSLVEDYRIEKGRVECRILSDLDAAATESEWRPLTPEQLTFHVLANRVLAQWLEHRMGVFRLVAACNPESMSSDRSRDEHPQRVAA